MNTEQNQLFLSKETSKLFSSTTAFQSGKRKKEHNVVIIVPYQHFSASALWWVFHLHCEVWAWKEFCAFFLCWFATKPQAVIKSGWVTCLHFSDKDNAFVLKLCGETSGSTRNSDLKHGLRLCQCDCILQVEHCCFQEELTNLFIWVCAGKHLWHRGTKVLLASCTSYDFSLPVQSHMAVAPYILIFESLLHEIFLWDQGSVSSMRQGFAGYKIQMF